MYYCTLISPKIIIKKEKTDSIQCKKVHSKCEQCISLRIGKPKGKKDPSLAIIDQHIESGSSPTIWNSKIISMVTSLTFKLFQDLINKPPPPGKKKEGKQKKKPNVYQVLFVCKRYI